MDAISAITTVGSLLNSARGFVKALRGDDAPRQTPPIRALSGGGAFSKDLQEAVAALVKAKDKNGDGVLSAQELGLAPEAIKGVDRSGDGKLDTMELLQAMRGSKGPL